MSPIIDPNDLSLAVYPGPQEATTPYATPSSSIAVGIGSNAQASLQTSFHALTKPSQPLIKPAEASPESIPYALITRQRRALIPPPVGKLFALPLRSQSSANPSTTQNIAPATPSHSPVLNATKPTQHFAHPTAPSYYLMPAQYVAPVSLPFAFTDPLEANGQQFTDLIKLKGFNLNEIGQCLLISLGAVFIARWSTTTREQSAEVALKNYLSYFTKAAGIEANILALSTVVDMRFAGTNRFHNINTASGMLLNRRMDGVFNGRYSTASQIVNDYVQTVGTQNSPPTAAEKSIDEILTLLEESSTTRFFVVGQMAASDSQIQAGQTEGHAVALMVRPKAPIQKGTDPKTAAKEYIYLDPNQGLISAPDSRTFRQKIQALLTHNPTSMAGRKYVFPEAVYTRPYFQPQASTILEASRVFVLYDKNLESRENDILAHPILPMTPNGGPSLERISQRPVDNSFIAEFRRSFLDPQMPLIAETWALCEAAYGPQNKAEFLGWRRWSPLGEKVEKLTSPAFSTYLEKLDNRAEKEQALKALVPNFMHSDQRAMYDDVIDAIPSIAKGLIKLNGKVGGVLGVALRRSLKLTGNRAESFAAVVSTLEAQGGLYSKFHRQMTSSQGSSQGTAGHPDAALDLLTSEDRIAAQFANLYLSLSQAQDRQQQISDVSQRKTLSQLHEEAVQSLSAYIQSIGPSQAAWKDLYVNQMMNPLGDSLQTQWFSSLSNAYSTGNVAISDPWFTPLFLTAWQQLSGNSSVSIDELAAVLKFPHLSDYIAQAISLNSQSNGSAFLNKLLRFQQEESFERWSLLLNAPSTTIQKRLSDFKRALQRFLPGTVPPFPPSQIVQNLQKDLADLSDQERRFQVEYWPWQSKQYQALTLTVAPPFDPMGWMQFKKEVLGKQLQLLLEEQRKRDAEGKLVFITDQIQQFEEVLLQRATLDLEAYRQLTADKIAYYVEQRGKQQGLTDNSEVAALKALSQQHLSSDPMRPLPPLPGSLLVNNQQKLSGLNLSTQLLIDKLKAIKTLYEEEIGRLSLSCGILNQEYADLALHQLTARAIAESKDRIVQEANQANFTRLKDEIWCAVGLLEEKTRAAFTYQSPPLSEKVINSDRWRSLGLEPLSRDVEVEREALQQRARQLAGILSLSNPKKPVRSELQKQLGKTLFDIFQQADLLKRKNLLVALLEQDEVSRQDPFTFYTLRCIAHSLITLNKKQRSIPFELANALNNAREHAPFFAVFLTGLTEPEYNRAIQPENISGVLSFFLSQHLPTPEWRGFVLKAALSVTSPASSSSTVASGAASQQGVPSDQQRFEDAFQQTLIEGIHANIRKIAESLSQQFPATFPRIEDTAFLKAFSADRAQTASTDDVAALVEKQVAENFRQGIKTTLAGLSTEMQQRYAVFLVALPEVFALPQGTRYVEALTASKENTNHLYQKLLLASQSIRQLPELAELLKIGWADLLKAMQGRAGWQLEEARLLLGERSALQAPLQRQVDELIKTYAAQTFSEDKLLLFKQALVQVFEGTPLISVTTIAPSPADSAESPVSSPLPEPMEIEESMPTFGQRLAACAPTLQRGESQMVAQQEAQRVGSLLHQTLQTLLAQQPLGQGEWVPLVSDAHQVGPQLWALPVWNEAQPDQPLRRLTTSDPSVGAALMHLQRELNEASSALRPSAGSAFAERAPTPSTLNTAFFIQGLLGYLQRQSHSSSTSGEPGSSNNPGAQSAATKAAVAHVYLNLAQATHGASSDLVETVTLLKQGLNALTPGFAVQEKTIASVSLRLNSGLGLIMQGANVGFDLYETIQNPSAPAITQLSFDTGGLGLMGGSALADAGATTGVTTLGGVLGGASVLLAGLGFGFKSLADAFEPISIQARRLGAEFAQIDKAYAAGGYAFDPSNNVYTPLSGAVIEVLDLSGDKLQIMLGSQYLYRTTENSSGGGARNYVFWAGNKPRVSMDAASALEIRSEIGYPEPRHTLTGNPNTTLILPGTPNAFLRSVWEMWPGATTRTDAGFNVLRRLENSHKFDYDFYVFPAEYTVYRMVPEYKQTRVQVRLGAENRSLLVPRLSAELSPLMVYDLYGKGAEYSVALQPGVQLKLDETDADSRSSWFLDSTRLDATSFSVTDTGIQIGGTTITVSPSARRGIVAVLTKNTEGIQQFYTVDWQSKRPVLTTIRFPEGLSLESADANLRRLTQDSLVKHQHLVLDHFPTAHQADGQQASASVRAYYEVDRARYLYTNASEPEVDTRQEILLANDEMSAYFNAPDSGSLWRTGALDHRVKARYQTLALDLVNPPVHAHYDGKRLWFTQSATSSLQQAPVEGVYAIDTQTDALQLHAFHVGAVSAKEGSTSLPLICEARVLTPEALYIKLTCRRTPPETAGLTRHAMLAERVSFSEVSNGKVYYSWWRRSDGRVLRPIAPSGSETLFTPTIPSRAEARLELQQIPVVWAGTFGAGNAERFFTYLPATKTLYEQSVVSDEPAVPLPIASIEEMMVYDNKPYLLLKTGVILGLDAAGEFVTVAVKSQAFADSANWSEKLGILAQHRPTEASSNAPLPLLDLFTADRKTPIPAWFDPAAQRIIVSTTLAGKEVQYLGLSAGKEGAWLASGAKVYWQPVQTAPEASFGEVGHQLRLRSAVSIPEAVAVLPDYSFLTVERRGSALWGVTTTGAVLQQPTAHYQDAPILKGAVETAFVGGQAAFLSKTQSFSPATDAILPIWAAPVGSAAGSSLNAYFAQSPIGWFDRNTGKRLNTSVASL